MKIVKLKQEFKEYILDRNQYMNLEGIGLYFYLNGDWIFTPITSKKRKFQENDNRYFSIDKYGTLLIGDYIYVKSNLIFLAKEDGRIKNEIIFLRKHKKVIEKKLRFQINRSKYFYDKDKKEWLDVYTKKSCLKNRERAKQYAKKAIQSMAVLEKVKLTKNEIEEIIEFSVLDRTDTYEVKTIFNLKDAWEHMIRTLDDELNLKYIIGINERIANHQALKVGVIRDQVNYVSGEFKIEAPKEKKLKLFLSKIVPKFNGKEELVFSLFLNVIVNQWFFDGNKRTAFVVINKILFQLGLGIFLIEDRDQEEFNELLYEYYSKTDYFRKDKLVEFLMTKCFKRF